MGRPSADSIIEIVTASEPHGVSSTNVADILKCEIEGPSYVMGYLFFRGKLSRTFAPHRPGVYREYIYRLPQTKVQSPPVQWQPQARLAGRAIKDTEAEKVS